MPLASLLLIMLALFADVSVANAEPCQGRFKKIALWTYKKTFKNTVNDYRRAWGRADEGRSYRLLNRFMFAPRVRERNPAKRAEALKKIQWMAALNEPVFDGAIELASKAKVVGGKWMGIQTKPIESNISIPGGIVISAATGYGTMAYLTEKAEEYIRPTQEEMLEKLEEKDVVSSKYLAAWEKIGILTGEQRFRASNNHVAALKAWGSNLSNKSKHRPLPPRLYQLRLEGMLKSQAEVNELEDIAFTSLLGAQKAVANFAKGKEIATRSLQGTRKVAGKNSELKEDQEIKRRIRQKLNESDNFKGRTPLEKELLTMVLDAPVFLDGMVSNIWYMEAVDGEYGNYKERRKQSDTYWLTQLVKNQKDPTLAKIREEFLKEPKSWDAPFLATYAALNFSPQAKPNLPELRDALQKKERDEFEKSINERAEKRAAEEKGE